ncbi:hypothetical protein AWC11_07625 [Mycobacterium interjectum]|nr:hypothetical protein AWC11_07625 [Mycobacterium interjectum]
MKRALAAAALAAVAVAAPAHADPPPWADPHYPDKQHGSCEGGQGGAFGFGWCDGAHYGDGSYWHQTYVANQWGTTAQKPVCMGADGNPAPPGSCGGYG